ncbi:LysR family transcriptional regulator [Pseudomonas putida]|uniref:LysR family transcriptional regulator n=1 Tax=Pseudomonas putida TaxID=303 RepID=A0A8I1JKQ8_PSEPU|nr:LysR family transcriptional regulator [Pseudomonas putida]MBI6884979.1 LysR family transcriptional regulator [Pseudomonas putida]
MFRTEDLSLFVKAAELESLSSAARSLNTSPAVASSAIKRLEERLGVRLFVRSTRSICLTTEGSDFYSHARSALQTLEDGYYKLQKDSDIIQGILRVSAPSDLGRNILSSWLADFQNLYPRLRVCLQLGDGVADLYRQPVDIAIRYGELPDSSLVALPLVRNNRRVLCAAPSYIARKGVPECPEDLFQHECILYERSEKLHDKWTFMKAEEISTVQVFGRLFSNDADVVRRWAIEGRGLVYKSWLDVALEVQQGQLQIVMPGFVGETAPLSMVLSHRLQLNKKFRVFYEYLKGRCSNLPSMSFR